MSPPAPLPELAPELLEIILSYLSPAELVSFGSTCRRFTAFIQPTNQILWRSAFLQDFDHPRHAWGRLQPTARAQNRSRELEWDWFREVHRRYTAFKAALQDTRDLSLSNLERVVTTLLDVFETASASDATDTLLRRSLNLHHLDRIFEQSINPEGLVHDYHRTLGLGSDLSLMPDLDRPITRSMLERAIAVPVWASRFHVYYGMTKREKHSARAMSLARSYVYNWEASGPEADHGPFQLDRSGSVNWQALEAVTSLMHRIFHNALELNGHPLFRTWGFRRSIPYSLRPSSASNDWAGINRSWIGTYAFLDYRALVHYNFATRLERPMDLGRCEEACGDLMELDLEVSDSGDLRVDRALQTDLPYCTDLPMLFFKGSSSSRTGGPLATTAKGFVCLVPGAKQVRWRFVIGYGGADRWQLEGVQPGGIRSGGIYGLWSQVDHEANGPVGPFCYFPIETLEAPKS